MKTVDFVEQLKHRGIHLQINAGKLRIQSPKGSITPELYAELNLRKTEILAFLQTLNDIEYSNATDPSINGKFCPQVIGRLISGSYGEHHRRYKSPNIDPYLMAKQLKVTFRPLPKKYFNKIIIEFREQLYQKLKSYGVQIIPWEKATCPMTYPLLLPFGLQKSITVDTVKSDISAVIDIEHPPSVRSKLKLFIADQLYQTFSVTTDQKHKLSASKIVQFVSWADKNIRNLENPTNTQEVVLTDYDSKFAHMDIPYVQKIPIGINLLLRTFSEIVIGVSDSRLSVLNLNLSDTLYLRKDLDTFVLNSLIPKIYVPILPLPISRFKVSKFDPSISEASQNLIRLGYRMKTTKLLPAGFKVSEVVRHQFQKDILDWIVKGRTGVSYGFIAYVEPPVYVGAPIISLDEWDTLLSIQSFSPQVLRQNSIGRRYIKLLVNSQFCYKQIPDIWVCSSRSGAPKTQLNIEQDVVRIGLTNALELQLPSGVDPIAKDVKPSYDLYVMLALGLGSNLYLPDLVNQGSAMVHFHGYPAAKWFQSDEYFAGANHPSVPCGTYESGIFNFLGIQTIAECSTKNIRIATLVEPDHGCNMIARDMDYLLERLTLGVKQGQIELGGKHMPSLKALSL